MTYLVQLFENSTSKEDRPQEPRPYNGEHPVYYSEQAFGPYVTCALEHSYATEEKKSAEHIANLLNKFWRFVPEAYWRAVEIPTVKVSSWS